MKAILTRGQMITAAEAGGPSIPLIDSGVQKPAVIGPWETLRSAAEKMSESKLRSFPVVNDGEELVGILNIEDLLEARGKANLRERERHRVLRLRWPFGHRQGGALSVDHLVDRAFESAHRASQTAGNIATEEADATAPQLER